MNRRSLAIVVGFSLVLAVVWAVMGIQSAAAARSMLGGQAGPASIDVLQYSLIQGAFTTTYVVASLAFLLIGMLGIAMSQALKTLEARISVDATK